MTFFPVTLGGFSFQDFEVPENLPFGGRQMHAKNIMIGGKRQIDALGWDPSDINWGGRFRGAAAQSRAMALQAVAQSGRAVPLMWGGMFYRVLVEGFHADYQRPMEIPYEINCVVIDDPSAGIGSFIGSTLDSLVASDMSSARGFLA